MSNVAVTSERKTEVPLQLLNQRVYLDDVKARFHELSSISLAATFFFLKPTFFFHLGERIRPLIFRIIIY